MDCRRCARKPLGLPQEPCSARPRRPLDTAGHPGHLIAAKTQTGASAVRHHSACELHAEDGGGDEEGEVDDTHRIGMSTRASAALSRRHPRSFSVAPRRRALPSTPEKAEGVVDEATGGDDRRVMRSGRRARINRDLPLGSGDDHEGGRGCGVQNRPLWDSPTVSRGGGRCVSGAASAAASGAEGERIGARGRSGSASSTWPWQLIGICR